MTFKGRVAGSEGDNHAGTRGKSIPVPRKHVYRGIELEVCLDIQGTVRKPGWLEQSEGRVTDMNWAKCVLGVSGTDPVRPLSKMEDHCGVLSRDLIPFVKGLHWLLC